MTFYQWLRRQAHRDDPVGDVAQDCIRDKRFPKRVADFEQAEKYLHRERASNDCIRAMKEAWDEYLDPENEMRWRRD